MKVFERFRDNSAKSRADGLIRALSVGRRAAETAWCAGRRAGHEVLELLCPAACAACEGQISDSKEVLCPECWGRMRENLQGQGCPVCGHDVGPYALIGGRCHRCQGRRPGVSRVVRVGNYSGALREMILGFKFAGKSYLEVFLGELLADAMLGDGDLRQVDLLVPIPLHWRRRWERKYNQAELLARMAATKLRREGWAVPIGLDLLRIRYTEPQTSLAVSHRLRNLRGAFAVRTDSGYEGKHICLIDDVTTTGTTLRVAAQALKKAGVGRVSAAVLAVAAND